MVWSNEHPPLVYGLTELPDGVTPIDGTKKTRKLEATKDKIYTAAKYVDAVPTYLLQGDTRVVVMLIEACADMLEDGYIGEGKKYETVYGAVLPLAGGKSTTAKTKGIASHVENICSAVLAARFPAFRMLTIDQVIHVLQLDTASDVQLVLTLAAVTHVVSAVNHYVRSFVNSGVAVPLLFVTTAEVVAKNWDLPSGKTFQLGRIPESAQRPTREAGYADLAADNAALLAKVADLQRQQPAEDPPRAITENQTLDRAESTKIVVSAVSEALEAERPSKKARTSDGEGESPLNPAILLTLDQTARLAALNAPPGAIPDDFTAFGGYSDKVFRAVASGQPQQVLQFAYVHISGNLADAEKFRIKVSDVTGDLVGTRSKQQSPLSQEDWVNTGRCLEASIRPWSPADANVIALNWLNTVVTAQERSDGDPKLVVVVVTDILVSYLIRAHRGLPGNWPVCDAAHVTEATRRLTQARKRALAEAELHREHRRRSKHKKLKKGTRNPADRSADTIPGGHGGVKFPSTGTARISPRTKLQRTKTSGARERCNNHDHGNACAFAYANGNCTRVHVGEFGNGGPSGSSSSSGEATD